MNLPLNTINLSDNIEFIKSLPDNSIDTIITDSPYGLGKKQNMLKLLRAWIDHGYYEITGGGFMGKKWDAFVPQPVLWIECFRVLKPGGHLVSFFGTRTYHLGALAIELAGFEIRDQFAWIYGSGFPKSQDIAKAIDKAAGAERKIISTGRVDKRLKPGASQNKEGSWIKDTGEYFTHTVTEPATEEAKKHEGYGTAVKPAIEPICIARKPCEGSTFENVIKHGTGAMNINAGRIGIDQIKTNGGVKFKNNGILGKFNAVEESTHTGRFPANIIFDEESAQLLDQQTGQLKSGSGNVTRRSDNKVFASGNNTTFEQYGDIGGASRFFYCAKASVAERAGMKHPTIKPIKLIIYLVKLFCRPGSVVLDPHSGTGPICEAALEVGVKYIAIDNDPKSVKDANNRVDRWYKNYL